MDKFFIGCILMVIAGMMIFFLHITMHDPVIIFEGEEVKTSEVRQILKNRIIVENPSADVDMDLFITE